ncbi:MAG: hypothetical protein ACE5JX_22245, partial [Acidobacteriota bacterium]
MSFTSLRDLSRRRSPRLTTTALFGLDSESASELEMPLVLFNRGQETLSPRLILSIKRREAGEAEVMEKELELGAGSGDSLDLADLWHPSGDDEWATLDLTWPGEPEALLASCFTIDGGRAVRNPLVDPEGSRPRSSNYAVLLGEGLCTRLYVKNPDSEEHHFIAHLFLEDGSEYDLGG